MMDPGLLLLPAFIFAFISLHGFECINLRNFLITAAAIEWIWGDGCVERKREQTTGTTWIYSVDNWNGSVIASLPSDTYNLWCGKWGVYCNGRWAARVADVPRRVLLVLPNLGTGRYPAHSENLLIESQTLELFTSKNRNEGYTST